MRAEEYLRTGDLDAALEALQNDIRANAADAKLRIFLFQLLSVMGNWKRAINQLKVSAELDGIAIPMAQTYREAIICEVYREKVFSGEKEPLIFGEPQEWLALMIEAQKLLGSGKAAQAADLRARAFDLAPAVSGKINGEAFDWIADADMRLGPVLEIVVNGRYFWMPFNRIASLIIEPPEDLRDAVWTPATLKLPNGGEVVALIPSRYAGTAQSGDQSAMLSRSTEWVDRGAETFVGIGQRILATSGADFALMDVRTLTMDVPDQAQNGDAPHDAEGSGGNG